MSALQALPVDYEKDLEDFDENVVWPKSYWGWLSVESDTLTDMLVLKIAQSVYYRQIPRRAVAILPRELRERVNLELFQFPSHCYKCLNSTDNEANIDLYL